MLIKISNMQFTVNSVPTHGEGSTRQFSGLKVRSDLRSGGEIPKNDNPKPTEPSTDEIIYG